jgi:vanillate O-demethylase ferredoxin subunit
MSFPMTLRVVAARAEARDVMTFDLRGSPGTELPPFEPGAHLELELPGEGEGARPLVRHYSLCNAPAARDRYVIAVALDAASRGGSRALHARLRAGDLVQVRSLANHFPLAADASRHRFVAGGIGITPIRSMIHRCEEMALDWSLLYVTRSRVRTAFLDELQALGDRVSFHFADEHAGRRADVAQALAVEEAGEHVYCCGPGALMRSVAAATGARAPGSVHFEWFALDAPPAAQAIGDRPFEIALRRSGLRLRVEAGTSILETLEAHGLGVPFSCREGLCRTCETPLCAGEAEHRDLVLSDVERGAQASLMVCVSRARSDVLELDL